MNETRKNEESYGKETLIKRLKEQKERNWLSRLTILHINESERETLRMVVKIFLEHDKE